MAQVSAVVSELQPVHRRFQQCYQNDVIRGVRTDLTNAHCDYDAVDESDRYIDAARNLRSLRRSHFAVILAVLGSWSDENGLLGRWTLVIENAHTKSL